MLLDVASFRWTASWANSAGPSPDSSNVRWLISTPPEVVAHCAKASASRTAPLRSQAEFLYLSMPMTMACALMWASVEDDAVVDEDGIFVEPPQLDCVVLLDRKSTRLNSSHLGISYA